MEQKTNLIVLGSLLFLICVNLIFLDVIIFSKNNIIKNESVGLVESSATSAVPTPVADICPLSCTQLIKSEISKIPVPAVAAPITQKIQTATTQQREYYIPLGSGKTKNDQWEEVPGAEAYIDTRRYPNIKEISFEVYLRVPTGIGWVFVKLINVTDKNDVWGTEVSAETTTSTRKEIAIQLPSGNKLYRVMIKSTLRADAYLDNARIKIISN